MEKIGSVYILETEDKTLLKIGYSTRLLMRLRELAKHILGEFHAGVRLIGFFPATRAVETELHRRFAAHRIHGDWYRREPVLEAFANVVVPIVKTTQVVTVRRPALPVVGSVEIVEVARKGGLASAASLTAQKRIERAHNAAVAKWDRYYEVNPGVAMVQRRNEKLSPERRKEIAQTAAAARWAKRKVA